MSDLDDLLEQMRAISKLIISFEQFNKYIKNNREMKENSFTRIERENIMLEIHSMIID